MEYTLGNDITTVNFVILTGNKILENIELGNIVITPFDSKNIESNSYRFHLSDVLINYNCGIVDAYSSDKQQMNEIQIPEDGYVLQPNTFYLGCTVEKMGSRIHACELYARLSTSLCGMFIQTSAPLGHTGAIIPWTLEIMVSQPVRIYPYMPIGKICFWRNLGPIDSYAGRYRNSKTVLQSMLSGANP